MSNVPPTEETPNEIANKILNEHLEGKTFGFIKLVCESILSVIDDSIVSQSEIDNFKFTSEKLLGLSQVLRELTGFQVKA
jgi:hypothetical protein